jgi:propanol-preferring alcohol dehydrogenase
VSIVGLAGGTFPMAFGTLPLEWSAGKPSWGTLPELHEVVALAHAGAIDIEVERLPLEDAVDGYRRPAQRRDRGTGGGRAVTLEGKVAVVTGGGSGIGEAICIRLAPTARRSPSST